MTRKSNHHNRQRAKETGCWFSFEQIDDVLALIAAEKWPDGGYSDDECVLWELIRNRLDIHYW